MNCEGTKTATVTYLNKFNVKTKFISQAPITTECSDLPRTGKFIHTVRSSGYISGTCTPIGDRGYSLEIASDSYTNTTPPPQPSYENCFFTTFNFFIGDKKIGAFLGTSDALIASIPNPNYSKGGKYLTIKNAQGVEIFKTEVKECGEVVTCDDDCPPGHIKCQHSKYPGYCCIPCKQTAEKINDLANRIK